MQSYGTDLESDRMRLRAQHPAVSEGRTIHPSTRRDPLFNENPILKSASENNKLGNGNGIIAKGKWKGMPMFSLTLEERATCPSDCLRWRECYGNSMAFAHRFEHGPRLVFRLNAELRSLSEQYPNGFVVRLHVLGDFYSKDYVDNWLAWLDKYPGLRVFGYSAQFNNPIAYAISAGRVKFPERWWIRFSRNHASTGKINLFASQEGTVGNAILCLEQAGKVSSCLDCGLCWETTRTIAFADHDSLRKRVKVMEA